MLTSPGQVYLRALQVLGSHLWSPRLRHQSLLQIQPPPPFLSTGCQHRSVTLPAAAPRGPPFPKLLLSCTYIYICVYTYTLLLWHAPGASAAAAHPACGDAGTHTQRCLHARTSFVWISSKPFPLPSAQRKTSWLWINLLINCHCWLDGRWDSEEA